MARCECAVARARKTRGRGWAGGVAIDGAVWRWTREEGARGGRGAHVIELGLVVVHRRLEGRDELRRDERARALHLEARELRRDEAREVLVRGRVRRSSVGAGRYISVTLIMLA